MKHIILKNTHFSLPPIFRRFKGLFDFEYEFTFHTSYHIPGEDQLDWNKLIGVKTDYFTPMKSSVMIGYRYNESTSLMELCTYTHDQDGKRNISDVVASVPLDTPFRILFSLRPLNSIYVMFRVGDFPDWKAVSIPYFKSRYYYLINTWFGGTSPAPSTQKITIKKIK